MDLDFPDYLRGLLAARGLTLTAFSKAIGRSTGNLSNILKQDPTAKTQFKPPLDEIPQWADALDLSPQERAWLIELAELAHAPAGLRAKYLALRQGVAPATALPAPSIPTGTAADLAKARAANALLVERLAEVEARLAKAEAELAAHRREQAALADLLTKPTADHDLAWEPDTAGLPALRVADAPATPGAPYGSDRP